MKIIGTSNHPYIRDTALRHVSAPAAASADVDAQGGAAAADRVTVSTLARACVTALDLYDAGERSRPAAVARAQEDLARWDGLSDSQVDRIAASLLGRR